MHQHTLTQNRANSRRLIIATLVNLALVVAQFTWGMLANSLALIADAVHNLSDAGTIIIALVARNIAKLPPSNTHTFGYKRAEILGALINCSSLIFLGIFLAYQAVMRFLNPTTIEGAVLIWVALLALVVDSITAYMMYRSGSKKNLKIRAAFLHNLADAFASIAVIIAGILIYLFGWYFIDLIATIAISAYILIQGLVMIRACILILMQGVPEHIDPNTIRSSLLALDGVDSINSMHVWQLDNDRAFLDASISTTAAHEPKTVQKAIKNQLIAEFGIYNSTIELH